jgi:hypothetical protein
MSRDKPYPSYLFCGEGVYGLLRQETVALAQPFLQLADSFMRLLLGCTKDPLNPGFEVGGPAF